MARQLIIEWEDQGAVDALRLGSEGTFIWNYGDQEDWIIEGAAQAIGIRNLSYKFTGDAAHACFGDRQATVPAESEPTSQRMLLRTLNETLSPEFEFRRIRDRYMSSSFSYMPLDGASWAKLEKEFGSKKLDQVLERLDFDKSVGCNRNPVKTKPAVHRLPCHLRGPVLRPSRQSVL